MSNRPARRASSKRDIVNKVDGPDPDGSDASNLATPRKKRKTIGLKLSLTLRLLAAFLLAMTYIAGDLVFSDAAFKASDLSANTAEGGGGDVAAQRSSRAQLEEGLQTSPPDQLSSF